MKRALVTGSSGFVGGVLAAVLEADGFDVWGVDHKNPSVASQHHVVADLTEPGAVRAVLDDVRPDVIAHLAAQSSAGRSFEEPAVTIQQNVLPAIHLLEYVRTHDKATRLLVVGSSEVYGPVDVSDMPIAETRPPNPVSPYALSKTMQEDVSRHYAALYDIDVVITRSFNHTGAGQADTFVLPSFARQITEIKRGTRPPRVHVGNIEAKRDFLDVRDVCRAYAALLRTGKRGAVYNVCSGTAYSLRELLEKLAAIAGVEIEIEVERDRMRPADIPELRGDNTRLKTDTGWQPEVTIDQTLSSLLNHWLTDRKES